MAATVYLVNLPRRRTPFGVRDGLRVNCIRGDKSFQLLRERGPCGRMPIMDTILWIIAVILVIAGIVMLVRRQIIPGIVLIVVGLLVGPGGVSILS